MRLKTLRGSKRLTQVQLAEKLGVGKGSISRYEQSAMYPSVDVLIKLCNYFDVSADYLLGLSDEIGFKMSSLKDAQIEMIIGVIGEFERLNAFENSVD